MSTTTASVLQTVKLGDQWPVLDPFLFCAHHLDFYPAGNDQAGPSADLSGREIGSDFAGKDGWRMYHGHVVPGFPQHPHRGFETVTIARRGLIDHADSLGAGARYGNGDVQWLTAGSGIQHAEMFPLINRDGDNTFELFQLWLNLPAANKMVDPHFTMFWAEDIPTLTADGVTVEVIAGRLDGADAPLAPPPESWASDPRSDIALWRISLAPGASWTAPPANLEGTNRVIYAFEGDGLTIDGTTIDDKTGAVVDPSVAVTLTTDPDGRGAELLLIQGHPIGEPVAQHGPFVMNTREEIMQAFEDYRRTQFGGWPWDRPDPVHGTLGDRFAKHPDGRTDRPNAN